MTAFLYPVTPPIKLYTDKDGLPLDNGYVYFGAANQNPETNPVQMYWDSAGLIPAAQPLRTINGYITRQGTPANIFSTGDMSVTVRDSNGALIFTSPTSTDLQLALAIAGASSAAAIPIADVDGHYTTDNVEAALKQIGDDGFTTLDRLAAAVQKLLTPVGAVIDYTGKTTLPGGANGGWIWASGRTIGNASSNATERKNADTIDLYTLLWNDYTNTELPILDSAGSPTTRGVSAANDFAANKALTVPDCRGRVRAGKDDMGGSTASRLTVAGGSFDGTVMGKAGGIQAHALSEAELATHAHAPGNHLHTGPSHTHGIGNHTHDITHTHPDVQPGNKSGVDASGTMFYYNTTTGTTASQSAANTSVAGSGTSSAAATGAEGTGNTSTPSAVNTGNIGSNTAHLNVQPTIVFTAIIKL